MLSHTAYFEALKKERMRWERELYCQESEFLKGILYGLKVAIDIARPLITEKVPGKYVRKGGDHATA